MFSLFSGLDGCHGDFQADVGVVEDVLPRNGECMGERIVWEYPLLVIPVSGLLGRGGTAGLVDILQRG